MGGPPYSNNYDSLDETQWVPYYLPNVHPNPQKDVDENGMNIQYEQEAGNQRAQIGKIPDGKGGSELNSNGLCWTYGQWSNYDATDIEDVWAEESRVWMLCCSDPAGESEKETDLPTPAPTTKVPTGNPTKTPTLPPTSIVSRRKYSRRSLLTLRHIYSSTTISAHKHPD